MKSLTVIYDPECGLCRLAKRWLTDQPRYLPMNFMPRTWVHDLQPALAKSLGGGDDLVVVSDAGEIWRGDTAFIMCLWATRRYRRLAVRLARPGLRPIARKAFGWVSANRRGLSNWICLNDRELREVVHRDAPPVTECRTIAQVIDKLKRERITT